MSHARTDQSPEKGEGAVFDEFHARRKSLVWSLQERRYISRPEVVSAMLSVRRELFVPANHRDESYADHPLEIGEGQTISAPHMVGIMVEQLDLRRGHRVLEIGGGSGYHAAVAAELVKPGGHVFSVERIVSLAQTARDSLASSGQSEYVTVIVGDGSKGLPEKAPFDRIFVSCAAPEIPPPLLEQLAECGKMLVPVGAGYQDLILVRKINGKLEKSDLGGCVFVPLLGEYGFRR